jgi:hypothetical protein
MRKMRKGKAKFWRAFVGIVCNYYIALLDLIYL